MTKILLNDIRNGLKAIADPKVAESGKRFFKDNEKFLSYGVKSSDVNKFAKQYISKIKELDKSEILTLCEGLWKSGYQEEMSISCIFTENLKSVSELKDFEIYANWLNKYVLNWAMCDTLCNHTIGEMVMKYPELSKRLFKWTTSNNRWVKRGAAVTLIIPARRGLFLPLIFRIADALIQDDDDIVQKGYGWMLKVASESYETKVFDFVMKRRDVMPRTALRYAIEKMPQEKRKLAMNKEQ